MKEKIFKEMQWLFWCVTILVVVGMAIFHFANDAKSAAVDNVDQTVSSIAILMLLIGIPASLKIYHLKTAEKVPVGKSEEFLCKYLQRHFFFRYCAIMVIMISNYLALELFGYSTASYGVAICLIILLCFCRPSRASLEQTLSDMCAKSNPNE